MQTQQETIIPRQRAVIQNTVYTVLFTISLSHLLNDLMQSVIPSIYPMIKEKYNFSFTQIGIITLAFQLTASILQPFVGAYTDKKSKPFSLVLAMTFSLVGIIALSFATGFASFLVAVSLIGLGSSVFHPEASRVAQLASGGKKGLAQSIFQLGGEMPGVLSGPSWQLWSCYRMASRRLYGSASLHCWVSSYFLLLASGTRDIFI